MKSKHIQPFFAKQKASKPTAKAKKSQPTQESVADNATKKQPQAIAFIAGNTPLNFVLPNSFAEKLQQEEIEKVNAVFASNSNSKVSLTKNSSGKVVLHADSRKDFKKAVKQIAFKKPAAPMSESARDVLALVGGILGIVSAGTSPIPFFNFLSIFIGAAAIVLGVLGWKSERRKVWSRLGVILGAVGISLAIMFIVLYFVVFNLFYF
jgi:NCAIR mutase (PurE)-related protein